MTTISSNAFECTIYLRSTEYQPVRPSAQIARQIHRLRVIDECALLEQETYNSQYLKLWGEDDPADCLSPQTGCRT